MSRNSKIEKINAYNKLLGTTLKTVTKDEGVQAEVQAEFVAFVEDQLQVLMGEGGRDPSGFTEEEVSILKAFVANAQKKAGKPAPASEPVNDVKPQQPRTPIQKPLYRSSGDSRPLGNRKTDPGAAKGAPSPYTDALDRMDREGPEF